MLLGSPGASTSSKRDVSVVPCISVGTEGVGHHRVVRHEGRRPAVRTLAFVGHPQRTYVCRCEKLSLKSGHEAISLPVWRCVSATHMANSTPKHVLVFPLVLENPASLHRAETCSKKGVHGVPKVVIHGFCRFRMSSNLSRPVVVASRSSVKSKFVGVVVRSPCLTACGVTYGGEKIL